MYCPSCGNYNTDSSNFCKKCGMKLTDDHYPIPDLTDDTNNRTNRSDDIAQKQFSSSDNFYTVHNDKTGIAAARKKLGIGLIVAALILGLVGVYCSVYLSNSYKPITVQHGYRDTNSGELTIYGSSDIGGDYRAVSHYDSMKWLFIIGGAIIACAGFALYLSGKRFENLPLIKRHGHVVAVDNLGASIEFDDGTRSKFPYLSQIVLVNGDRGIFEIKENKIIAFKREQ